MVKISNSNTNLYYLKDINTTYYISGGFRNISNLLTIGTQIDLMSDGLKEYAKEKGYWNGSDPFHFADIFTEGTCKSSAMTLYLLIVSLLKLV